jgi:predicted CXXCH cytochrome family protein
MVPRGLAQEVMPNSSKECAICHIRWVQAFDRNETQEKRMDDVLERQAGSGDMCLSCHDGSVTDSRFKVWSTRHHTTDAVPSAAVRIPTDIFPLDDQGRMTCATCHTAHAVPESSDLRTVIFLRQPNVDSSLCLACHPEHAVKSDFQHPLGEVDYPIPQEILDAGGKTSQDGRTVICQTCHEPHGARNAWMLVLPPSKLCIACHTDKSPETSPPAGAPMHHIGQAYPGFEPPAALLEQKATFGPAGELSCLSCHRLHEASGAKPLLIRKNQDSSLCLDCHRTERAIVDSPHDLRISSPYTVNAGGQTASQSGPCGACHRIHGWARDVPDTHRPHSSGCMECHQSGGPGALHRLYVDAHAVGTPVPEDMPVLLPLDEATGSIGCLTCHDPHSPRSAKVEAETTEATPAATEGQSQHHPRITTPPGRIDSEIQEPRSFLRREGSQLCVLCHDRLTDLPGRPHDPAAFGPTARSKLLVHPSIGPCRVCHTTHSAQGPHLWARTPVAAGEQIADLCGACHRDKLGVKDSVHDPAAADWAKRLGFVSKGSCVDCHPVHDANEPPGIWGAIPGGRVESVGEQTTGQSCEACHRAGAPGKEMQTAHIGKILEGTIDNLPENMVLDPQRRILCTTCHDIHQKESGTKLLVATVPELCGICHRDKLGIQNSVHDPGTAEWAKKLGFVSKGSCIDCHPVHGPRGEGGIWANIGGADVSAQSCETCHRAGAPASAMETPHVGKSLETLDPAFDIEKLLQNMPLSPERRIACVTCHDIHQAGHDPKLLASPRTGSGVCLACHVEAGGLIGTLHDLRTSAPEAHNVRGETSAESGPCGSCHLVHVSSEAGGVWAQGSTLQGKGGSGYCTCCHSQGECASDRVAKYVDHPDVALVNRTRPGQPGYMPTFDPAGEPSDTGAISCLTCHEPHVAPPNATAGGANARRRMFLRPHASQELCTDCHGAETLWRFLYYHKERRNPYPERDLNWSSPQAH